MDSTKLAGGGGVTAKGDAKRRPKAVKRKKPNDSSAGGAPSLLSRIDGLSNAGSKSDSGIKLETSGDDSGINMTDTWQRNGHSADFIRQDGLPNPLGTSGGPGSVPPPCTSQDNYGSLMGPSSPRKSNFPNAGGTNCLPPMGMGPMRGGLGPMPPNGMPPMMEGNGPGGGMGNFMPQQSQVFVFSTSLANQAADAVQNGACASIIDFHLDQPMTRHFLQSLNGGGPHPSNPYLRPGYGLPDGGQAPMGDPSLGPQPPGDVAGNREMGGGSALANVELWVQQQNASLQEGPFSPSFGPSSQPLPPGHRPRPNSDSGSSQMRCCPGPHHPGSGDFGPGPGIDPMFGPQPPPGYVHDHLLRGIGGARVPDENLTPEQLQRREEQLAHIQKLKQMLFPGEKQGGGGGFEGGPPQRFPGGPSPGMYGRPGQMDEMRPMPPHHHMMNQPPQRFMHHGPPQGMMGPPPGMIDQPLTPDGMMMMGPPFGEAGLPPNWEMMTQEEREWFRLQQEYYMEQRQKRHMQMQQMGGGPPPPPGYFGDMPRQPPGRTSGPLSPVSPSFNEASPHDAQGFFFQGQPGMNFPPGRPNFGPNGPPNFNPEFGPHPDGPFPPYGNPMMMQDPGQFPGGRFQQGKPKRKRASLPTGIPGATDRPNDDIFRHLQPAPSPQQFCSLNLFDGQELTITKQLNLAYQEPTTSSPNNQAPSSTPPASTAPPSRKKKKVPTATLR